MRKGKTMICSRRITLVCILLLISSAVLYSQDLPSPKQYFGHEMGQEGEIVDYLKSLEYYKMLTDRSERAIFKEIGKTTDGNPFVVVIISSPENLARLEEIRTERNRLADARAISDEEAEGIARKMPAVVFHTGSIHSSEISTVQVPPVVIHRLVSSNDDEVKNILENTVILFSPSANPDGAIKYNKWYAAQKGKPWEGRMPWQYHTYVGHDNNRDWIMLHFPEQRLTATEIHMKWHPVYSLEMHEMGSTGARLFVPPYLDPSDPNTAPQIVNTMNILGMAISHRLVAEEKGGVVFNAIFDLYTPARAFQVYHGTGRILTETARGNFARSIEITEQQMVPRRANPTYNPLKPSWNFPLPWPAGIWSFKDRVDYQISANFALLNMAASHRYQFNINTYRALKRAVKGAGWPYAYVIPADQHDHGAAARLTGLLQLGGIEIHAAKAAFETEGQKFPAGSKVIVLRQPYAAWAKTLLEEQEYPDLRKSPNDPPVVPYDVTGHTLPFLMGVKAVKIEDKFDADLEPVTEKISPKGTVKGMGRGGFAIIPNSNDAFMVADKLLDDGKDVGRFTRAVRVGDAELPVGSFIISPFRGLADTLKKLAEDRGFTAVALDRKPSSNGNYVGLKNPRIAIYEPWGGTMDAGWTRLMLEHYELEFTTIRNKDVRTGDLNDRFDIILFTGELSVGRLMSGRSNWPDEYIGGIGLEGLENLKKFLSAGGMVMGWGGTSVVLSEVLDLSIANHAATLDRRSHFSPGSIVLATLDPSSPINYGMPQKASVMVRRSPLLIPEATPEKGPKFVAKYPEYDPRLSGFLLGPEHMQGKGAVAVQPFGKGKVILFSYLPQFRVMTHGTFKQIFNAIFWSTRN